MQASNLHLLSLLLPPGKHWSLPTQDAKGNCFHHHTLPPRQGLREPLPDVDQGTQSRASSSHRALVITQPGSILQVRKLRSESAHQASEGQLQLCSARPASTA